MGCDIHLHVETRNRKYDVDWSHCSFHGDFSCRTYKMFAALNNVRNDFGIKPLENRGIPSDLSFLTFIKYYSLIDDNTISDNAIYDNVISSKVADECVKHGISKLITRYSHRYISNPDFHNPNWCTTKELSECYDKVFKDGEVDVEWLALIGYMEMLESEDEFEVRAVFWFDN